MCLFTRCPQILSLNDCSTFDVNSELFNAFWMCPFISPSFFRGLASNCPPSTG
ncbi:hypothetical protein Mapa_010894 [Marchantia paleacea]|nr:hypothetical protein Mapa_010894 [Marchantia paleacea]